jgi:RNA polymerase sigma-70 factor, ECF subfamily
MQAGSLMGNLASAIAISSDEAALVEELKAGSERAFTQLIAQYHQPIYSVVARSLQDPADASDITQEVFIKVFRNIRGFHGQASLRTWIYRIALHEASNQRRWWSRHKRQEITMEAPCGGRNADAEGESLSLGATLADEHDSPFDHAAQAEVRERIEAALREIPEAFRTVVILREMEGFAYDEIAEILGVNLGTVKSRLTRGRTALREILAPKSRSAQEYSRRAAPRFSAEVSR